MMFNTPGGNTPAISSAMRSVASGVNGEGLSTIVQPDNKRRHNLLHRHQHRKIPRHDAADHADRNAARTAEALVAVFTDGSLQGSMLAERAAHADASGDFAASLHMWLALFRRQQSHQLVAVRLDRIGHFGKTRATFFDAGLLPFRECSAGGGNRGVEFGLTAIGHLADHLLGRWIDDVDPFVAADQFAVDQISYIASSSKFSL